MKYLRYSLPVSCPVLCAWLSLWAASAILANQPQAETQDEPSLAEARAAIRATYIKWGRARVELDKKMMDSILSPDFYVSLYGQKISREKFISDVSQERPNTRLSRFDTEVLTVQKTEKDWTVVIAEKLEFTIPGTGDDTRKAYSYWVTRDGWRKEGEMWLVTFSEAIGHETWLPGSKPPFHDW